MTRALRTQLTVQPLEDRCVPATLSLLGAPLDGAPFDPNLRDRFEDNGAETRTGPGGGAGKVAMQDIHFTPAAAPNADKYLELVGLAGETVDAGTASTTSGGAVPGGVTGIAVDPTSAIRFGGWAQKSVIATVPAAPSASSYQHSFGDPSGAIDDVFAGGKVITSPMSAPAVVLDTTADTSGHELGHALGFRHEHTRPASA